LGAGRATRVTHVRTALRWGAATPDPGVHLINRGAPRAQIEPGDEVNRLILHFTQASTEASTH